MAVLLFLIVLPIISGPLAAAQSSDALIVKTDIEEEAVLGNNGIYEKITLNVPFNVQVDGEYIIYANARPAGIDWDWSSTAASYKNGLNSVSLDIPGSAIFESRKNGPYDVELSILNKLNEPQDSETYTTKAYSYEDFDTSKLIQDIPIIVPDPSWYVLRFDTLTAEISKTSPMINYYYSEDTEDGEAGVYSKAVLKITRIIAFDDNNSDGIPQEEELKYRSNLPNLYWDSTIRTDKIYEIRLSADMVMRDINGGPGPRIDATFVFLAGGSKLSDQAVTMEIETSEPLDATHLCVETSFSDGSEEGGREFVFDNTAENKASFLGPKDKEQNYLQWQKKCTVEQESGPQQLDCTFNTLEGADSHLTYSTVEITTYTVGVTTGFNFGVTGEYVPPPKDYEHNVWIYFLGIGLAVLIVVASFVLQRKFSKKEVV